MNEKVKQAQETLLKLSALALKYLVNNFHYNSNEYANGKLEIGNLTDKLRITLNDFDKYHESQQDLIKGKDEYIAKLCNDRAELKAHEKELIKEQNRLFDLCKEQEKELNGVNDFRKHYKNYQDKLANNLKTINCMQEEQTTNYNLIEQLEDRNDRLVERLEKQKAELNDLREFAKIVATKGVAIGFIQLLEKENAGGVNEYNDYIGGDKKLYLTEAQFNLVKKVVEKNEKIN